MALKQQNCCLTQIQNVLSSLEISGSSIQDGTEIDYSRASGKARIQRQGTANSNSKTRQWTCQHDIKDFLRLFYTNLSSESRLQKFHIRFSTNKKPSPT